MLHDLNFPRCKTNNILKLWRWVHKEMLVRSILLMKIPQWPRGFSNWIKKEPLSTKSTVWCLLMQASSQPFDHLNKWYRKQTWPQQPWIWVPKLEESEIDQMVSEKGEMSSISKIFFLKRHNVKDLTFSVLLGLFYCRNLFNIYCTPI